MPGGTQTLRRLAEAADFVKRTLGASTMAAVPKRRPEGMGGKQGRVGIPGTERDLDLMAALSVLADVFEPQQAGAGAMAKGAAELAALLAPFKLKGTGMSPRGRVLESTFSAPVSRRGSKRAMPEELEFTVGHPIGVPMDQVEGVEILSAGDISSFEPIAPTYPGSSHMVGEPGGRSVTTGSLGISGLRGILAAIREKFPKAKFAFPAAADEFDNVNVAINAGRGGNRYDPTAAFDLRQGSTPGRKRRALVKNSEFPDTYGGSQSSVGTRVTPRGHEADMVLEQLLDQLFESKHGR